MNQRSLVSTSRLFLLLAALTAGRISGGFGLTLIAKDRASTSGDSRNTYPLQLASVSIENLFQLSPRIFSGGEPQGEEAFKQLHALGIRTILSVDGAVPDVAAARKHGMRYVHLPIGYDGVDRDRAVQFVRVLQELPSPVFIHCHHGRHRGPTAAALCGMATEAWSMEQALRWLETAGTVPEYSGLFASIRSFDPPQAEEIEASRGELPEIVRPAAIVEAMIAMDRHLDNLKAIRQAGFATPDDRPDLDPAHEALMLREQVVEAGRSPDASNFPEGFHDSMQTAVSHAAVLEAALRRKIQDSSTPSLDSLDKLLRHVELDCRSCHTRFRDDPIPRP